MADAPPTDAPPAVALPADTPLAAALLDLDGTLLDTAPALARALNTLLMQERIAPLPFATIRPWPPVWPSEASRSLPRV